MNERTLPRPWKAVSCLLIGLMGFFGTLPSARGDFVPSSLVAQPSERSVDFASIQNVLELKAVHARLEAIGFTKAEIERQMTRLSDSEVHQLATNLDELQAGGNWVLLLSIIIAVVVFAVVLELGD